MKRLPIGIGEFWIDHFFRGTGNHPYFAVYEGLKLVCVTVYRKGAEEVLRRLARVETIEEAVEIDSFMRR
jgi:hypothetical protein